MFGVSKSEVLDVLGRGELSVRSDGGSSGEIGREEGEVDEEEAVLGIGEVGIEWLGHR